MINIKSKALILESDTEGRIINVNVKNGKIYTDDGIFIIDMFKHKIKPIILNTFFGKKTLYILKWNSIIPCSFDIKENTEKINKINFIKREIVPLELKFVKTELPETIKNSFELEFIKSFSKYSTKSKIKLDNKFFIVGVIVFFIIVYAVIYSMLM